MRTIYRVALLLLLTTVVVQAEPPQVDIPAEVQATTEYVTIQPRTDAKAITYIGLSGVEPFPSMLLRDPRVFVLPTRGLPAARYRFAAVATLNDEQARTDFTVVVGTPGPGPDVPVPPPGPDPPPGPGPTDPFAKAVRKMLTDLGSHYSKEKALQIGKHYAAVAAEAVATQQLYDITAFQQKTKNLNQAYLGNDLPNWTPFFQQLAIFQSGIANTRGIDIYRDEAGLAQIWRETNEAIKAAAF